MKPELVSPQFFLPVMKLQEKSKGSLSRKISEMSWRFKQMNEILQS